MSLLKIQYCYILTVVSIYACHILLIVTYQTYSDTSITTLYYMIPCCFRPLLQHITNEKRRFNIADIDKDGKLSIDEYGHFQHSLNSPLFVNETVKADFKDIDGNSDGKISKLEFGRIHGE